MADIAYLYYEHRISKAEKSISLGDGSFICVHDIIIPRERRSIISVLSGRWKLVISPSMHLN